MCGISAVVHLRSQVIPDLRARLELMNRLQQHRGPDGEGVWIHPREQVGMGHRRLSIIDLEQGAQPMQDGGSNWISYNGEIYNYQELRRKLDPNLFRTASDTEVILQAYRKWGQGSLDQLRGMFAFCLWDESRQRLFCARDRFGIKPLYYAVVDDVVYLASEVKALLPFLDGIETNSEALHDYLAFQFCLEGKTLFKGVEELPPGHWLEIGGGAVRRHRYWEVYYHPDDEHTEKHFEERLRDLLADSVRVHLRSDVPVGAYVSGGLDSSIVASLARRQSGAPLLGFHGKFGEGPSYDESAYARALAQEAGIELHEVQITAADFENSIRRVIYHLDFPVAGPGSFPQFMVSGYASRHRKVLLGGQGGDEIFGGYTRYLIAYFEQCIKAAIDGTSQNGKFVVTYESIHANLASLRGYKPLLKEFWSEGLFDDMDHRYFRLVNRSRSFAGEVASDVLADYSPFDAFQRIFHGENVGKESYFDLMTHFDFKTLLPALLQVEDRVSMAHGLESRVPFLDHPLVEFAATLPANVKFKNGELKHILRKALGNVVPEAVLGRKDKMGFPVPLSEWAAGSLREFMLDVFSCKNSRSREIIDSAKVVKSLSSEPKFGRRIWALLCLELWHHEFHDRGSHYSSLLNEITEAQTS